jgi:hypothetical protein
MVQAVVQLNLLQGLRCTILAYSSWRHPARLVMGVSTTGFKPLVVVSLEHTSCTWQPEPGQFLANAPSHVTGRNMQNTHWRS